jgi:peptidoglycan/LPS O-acetylase OafA/YrhL
VLIAPLIARMLAGISTLQACARLVLLGALAFPLATVITPFGWSHEHVLHYTLFGRLPDFLAGMCAALVMRHRTAATIARHAWLSVFVLAGLASLSYLWNTHDETPLGRLQGIGYAAVSAWLIVGFAHPQGLLRQLGQLLSSAPLRWLGTLSFALYLIHLTEPVQYFYWIMIPPLTGDSAPLRVLLTLVFSLAVSMLLHGLIERPLNRIVSRWRRA